MICIKSCLAAAFANFVVGMAIPTVAEGDGLMTTAQREVLALEE